MQCWGGDTTALQVCCLDSQQGWAKRSLVLFGKVIEEEGACR